MKHWRAHLSWALLLSAAFVARTALDWLQPTSDFHLRSSVSTLVSALIFVGAGAAAGWRSGSWLDGPVAAFTTALLGAVMSMLGVAALYAIWHDPRTLEAIAGSGGLDEALFLPLLITLPGALLGLIGGLCGAAARASGGGAASVHRP